MPTGGDARLEGYVEADAALGIGFLRHAAEDALEPIQVGG